MLSIVQTLDFQEQATRDFEQWVKGKMPNIAASRLADFHAGHAKGYRDAISDLKRHGYKFKA